MKTKKNIYIGLLITVLCMMGISYAYFQKTLTQNTSNAISTLACLSLTLDETANTDINLSNIYPVSDEKGLASDPYQFNITNTCASTKMKVDIYLETNSSTLNINLLRASINTRGNVTNNSLIVGSQNSITTTNNKTGYLLSTQYLTYGQSEDLDLRLWVDKTATVDNAINKTYSGKIYISATAINTMPLEKGDLISMNVGTNLPTTYRIMKLNGTEAEVVAMSDYNVGTTYAFDADGTTTTFSDGSTALQYAGSDIDKLMNETFYKALNDTAQSALVAQNINQYMYGWTSNKLSDRTYWSSTYDFTTESTYYITKVGTGTTTSYATVGNRYVYLLDVKDILDYFDNPSFTKEQLNTLFFNTNTSFNGKSTIGNLHLWLRSTRPYYTNYAWRVNGYAGNLDLATYETSRGVRPAFTIDLSKVKWQAQSKITFNANGGTGRMERINTGLFSGTYTLPTTSTFIAPLGKQFKGWSLTSNGSIVTTVDASEDRTLFAIWEDKTLPYKGDIITMNVGIGLPTSYRVLNITGTQALVVSMTNNAISAYNTGTTTKFNQITGLQYAGGKIDTLLNTTVYNTMNSAAKAAIVPQTITQSMYSLLDEPNNLETSTFTCDYQYQYAWDDTDWDNINLIGTTSIGQRYIYLLDVKDIFDYMGKRSITSDELMTLFFNDTSSNDDFLWLRSAYDDNSAEALIVSGSGNLYYKNNDESLSVRGAFTIDLSKIAWSVST